MPPSPNNIRGRLREVSLRYARAQRRRDTGASILSRKRLRDLDRLFMHRYGVSTLPDDDAGRADLAVALDHLKRRPDAPLILKKWVASRTPWLDDQEFETMLREAGQIWTATELGTHLGLTDDERMKLKISTIAPGGLTKQQWENMRK